MVVEIGDTGAGHRRRRSGRASSSRSSPPSRSARAPGWAWTSRTGSWSTSTTATSGSSPSRANHVPGPAADHRGAGRRAGYLEARRGTGHGRRQQPTFKRPAGRRTGEDRTSTAAAHGRPLRNPPTPHASAKSMPCGIGQAVPASEHAGHPVAVHHGRGPAVSPPVPQRHDTRLDQVEAVEERREVRRPHAGGTAGHRFRCTADATR